MNNITITIQAPELVEAMQALTLALQSGAVKPAQVEAVVEKLEAEADKPSKAKKGVTSESQATASGVTAESEAPATHVTVTLEEVRGKLAALSQSGKNNEVKQLIASFGAKVLSGISKDRYAELLARAEEL